MPTDWRLHFVLVGNTCWARLVSVFSSSDDEISFFFVGVMGWEEGHLRVLWKRCFKMCALLLCYESCDCLVSLLYLWLSCISSILPTASSWSSSSFFFFFFFFFFWQTDRQRERDQLPCVILAWTVNNLLHTHTRTHARTRLIPFIVSNNVISATAMLHSEEQMLQQ